MSWSNAPGHDQPGFWPRGLESEPPPARLAAALKKNARARKTWDAFTPSHRRDYVEWIAAARKDETRDRRVQQTVSGPPWPPR
jgi:uncharacterized protein YdeI (YjbR/CyaY-like superfamily)